MVDKLVSFNATRPGAGLPPEVEERLDNRFALRGQGIDGTNAALGILRARLATQDTEPVPLVFAGSSTTEGFNTDESNRWINLIAERVTDRPVIFGYAAAAASAPFQDGITFINMGRSGTDSGGYITLNEAPVIGGWAPALVMHTVGANDSSWEWGTPANTVTNIRARIEAVDAASPKPVTHVLMHQHERYDRVPQYPWDDYHAALLDMAASFPNVTIFDITPTFEAVGVPGSDPLGLMMPDLVHINDHGHRLYADLVGTFLDLPTRPVIAQGGQPEPMTITLHDNFDRPDRSTITGDVPAIAPDGAAWAELAGQIGIVGGVLTPEVGMTTTALVDAGTPDIHMTVDVTYRDPSFIGGIVFRATDLNNRWGVYVFGGDGIPEVQLFRMVGGNSAKVHQVSRDFTPGEEMAVTVRCVGPNITVSINGARVLTYAMTAGEDAQSRGWTKVGPRITSGSLTMDNLIVYDATPSGQV